MCRCNYGDNCKFSHESPPNGEEQTPAKRPHQPPPNQDKLREWKRLLHQAHPDPGSAHIRLSPTVMSQFFERGLNLMDGDMGASQEVVKLLGSHTGLNFVKAIVDQHISQATSDVAKLHLWQTQVSPFFRLITHPQMVDSNVLEQEVATIYSFLVGVNASRVNKLAGFVLDVAEAWPSEVSSPLMKVLELFLSVLFKAIDCSTTIIVNDDFHRVVERLADLLNGAAEAVDDFASLQAIKYLNYLQLRLGVGKDMKAFETSKDTNPKREEFVLRRDLPGRLSEDGPRHDNDHEEISRIQIMPTYQEIMTPRNEYLPTTDSSQWHLTGIRGRLDREFRLLREDTIGQLRDAVRDIIGQVRSHSKNSARTSAYCDATIDDATIDKHKGLELEVRCRQPENVRKMGDQTRKDWWDQSKRLQAGALVCALDAAGTIQFLVVAESTLRTEKDKTKSGKPEDKVEKLEVEEKPHTLSYSPDLLYVRLNLVENSKTELHRALRWCKAIGSAPTRHLVEFPGVLLASFKHTLEALQRLSKNPDLPFSNLIAPEKPASDAEARLSAPLFARRRGFVYDLSCLTHNEENGLSASLDQLPAADEVSAKTGLDLTQSEALLSTLSRELSLIQGPPGTGKSYTGEKIIQVLLANRGKAKLGPIICVCYTNHALDQLLEHLLDHHVGSIIRMGSRSKSERLHELTLQKVAEKEDLTRTEKVENWQAGDTMRELEKQGEGLLRRLASCDTTKSIREYLLTNNEAHHDELFHGAPELDHDGYQAVQRKFRDPLHQWLRGGLPIDHTRRNARDIDELQLTRLMDMVGPERAKMYRHWLKNIRDPIIEEFVDLHGEHQDAKLRRDRIRQEARRRCLQQAQVIGVTTTGLARELDLLRKLRSKVVVCEEAGEVLEAHLLTTLLPSVEHAILIGDHLQLRPQIQNYELQSTNTRGARYSLDTSLFERLVQPPHSTDLRLPFSTLETQRRMHPSIADMVRSTLYNKLTDGENVKSYPEVVGMGRRLFWLHHDELEAGAAAADANSTSHSNNFEVGMVAALVSHLIKQGHYSPEDIAVLTPYLGQLQKLRQRMAMEPTFAVSIDERDLDELENMDAQNSRGPFHSKKQTVSKTTLLKSVRLATVDNFQGEEAKVIVISLVRSNPQNKCGFLSVSRNAARISRAVTTAVKNAISADRATTARSRRRTMEFANRHVAASTQHALIAVDQSAMARRSARPAAGAARSAAAILSAIRRAMSHVHHVQRKSAPPIVLIQSAACRVLLHVIGYPAQEDAQ
ncbi:hypothetical protein N0V82_007242 [Gnomoniopsis sp. IMI 355080]|nr:hypothetical protein N0V82_007242 [Gnomoniopsis sp. IMI 355080]